jgi:predicted Fe-Mo cluster-binding NifX family protein
MKIVIPQWQGRVSPVFDVAGTVILFDVEGCGERNREVVPLAADDPFEKAKTLSRLGAQVLICGAISSPMEMALICSGIQVIPYACGRVDDVLKAFLNGRLNEETFLMPGCDPRQRGIRAHRSRGQLQ